MTDLDKWKAFLAEFDIEFEVTHAVEPALEPNPYQSLAHLVFEEGMRNITGYVGFKCDITFDVNGKFVQVGIWE